MTGRLRGIILKWRGLGVVGGGRCSGFKDRSTDHNCRSSCDERGFVLSDTACLVLRRSRHFVRCLILLCKIRATTSTTGYTNRALAPLSSEYCVRSATPKWVNPLRRFRKRRIFVVGWKQMADPRKMTISQCAANISPFANPLRWSSLLVKRH